MWTSWNEPNHPVFLMPQWEKAGKNWRPASPHIYRALHNAAYQQLKNAVNPDNKVLIGGLASHAEPGKGAAKGIGPLHFTRELACVDGAVAAAQAQGLQEIEAAAGRRVRRCTRTRSTHRPTPATTSSTASRSASSTSSRACFFALKQRGRFAAKLPLYLTEYGYETSPQDPSGRPPWLVGHELGHATYLAWLNPDVRTYPQFLLQDIGPDGPSRSDPSSA